MKILLVDDHWVSRAALKSLLTQIDKKAKFLEADTFDDALKQAEGASGLKLVLLDLVLPGLDSLDGISRLMQKAPRVPVVVFSMVENRHEMLRTVEQGVAGFIPKTATGDEILKALEVVLSGELYLPRMLLKDSGQQSSESSSFMPIDAAPRQAIANLTPRQRQVLSYLAQGMTNTKIATELGLSENTVRIHISAILRTLDLDNRTQAALLAAEYLRTASTL
jgi:DNA-binding NarL/FixJ family response regulator